MASANTKEDALSKDDDESEVIEIQDSAEMLKATLASIGKPVAIVAPMPSVVSPTVQRQTEDNAKEKCRTFLVNLLKSCNGESRTVYRKLRRLIQDLIDSRIGPQRFCAGLVPLLNAQPQPNLIGFLERAVPLVRRSLFTREMVIEGINPPPASP